MGSSSVLYFYSILSEIKKLQHNILSFYTVLNTYLVTSNYTCNAGGSHGEDPKYLEDKIGDSEVIQTVERDRVHLQEDVPALL